MPTKRSTLMPSKTCGGGNRSSPNRSHTAQFGEDLTTEGIEVNEALVGERWEIGSAVLEVSEPRVPCSRLGARMNDVMFPRRFTEALRPGVYLRIIVEGNVGAGDEIH